MELLKFFAGLILALVGAYLLLLVLGFALLIDPSLDDWSWWSEYLDRVFHRALSYTLLFLTMIVVGVALSFHSLRRILASAKPQPSKTRVLDDF